MGYAYCDLAHAYCDLAHAYCDLAHTYSDLVHAYSDLAHAFLKLRLSENRTTENRMSQGPAVVFLYSIFLLIFTTLYISAFHEPIKSLLVF